MKKFKLKKIIMILLILLFITMLIVSIINIIGWKIDSNNTHKEIDNINSKTVIQEKEDNTNTEIIEPNIEVPASNPYWDYIKMNMIDVNFSELKSINNNVKGWIKINGTNINYPFVQTTDNKYYLNHSFNKSYNKSGWVFLDYRNNGTSNKNTIIYAHGRDDNTMFGTLKYVLNNGWLNDTYNFVIKISTEQENSLWQIFSAYHIPTTSDYIQTEFNDDNSYQVFLDIIKNRSAYNFNTNINSTDNILTLSTCYNSSEKMVVHAKLIKREAK